MEIVKNIEKVDVIRSQVRSFSFQNELPEYEFELQGLPDIVNQRITQQYRQFKHACGCFEGGLCMGITAFSILLYSLFSSVGFVSFFKMHGFKVLGILLLTAAVGKGFGLLYARFKFMRQLNGVYEYLSEPITTT